VGYLAQQWVSERVVEVNREVKGGEYMESKTKKSYRSPQLEEFGTVTELTLNACNTPGPDNKSCHNLEDIGRSTPGSDNAGFPK
jgi:hypothetical protein